MNSRKTKGHGGGGYVTFCGFCEHVMRLANLEERGTGSPLLHTCAHAHTLQDKEK